MNRIKRLIAAPLVSAGILAGVTLGMAGPADASVSQDGHGGITATPDTHARQVMAYPRFGMYYWPTMASAPHVDTAVHQSR